MSRAVPLSLFQTASNPANPSIGVSNPATLEGYSWGKLVAPQFLRKLRATMANQQKKLTPIIHLMALRGASNISV
jgi:hypothetical protein